MTILHTASLSGFYGDLQGIICGSLEQIEGMELLALEADDDTENEKVVA